MLKRSRKKDLNQMAYALVQQVTQEKTLPVKNPAAVALGRLGGMKGGKARARALSSKKRIAIAKKAANTRWTKLSKARAK